MYRKIEICGEKSNKTVNLRRATSLTWAGFTFSREKSKGSCEEATSTRISHYLLSGRN